MGKSISKVGVNDFCRKLCGVYRWKKYTGASSGNHPLTTDNAKNTNSEVDDVDENIDEEYFSKQDLIYYSLKYEPEEIELPCDLRYQRGKLLGAGSFGRVYLAINLDNGSTMAMKQIPLISLTTKIKLEDLQREIKVLSTMKHQNIVKYIGCTKDSEFFNIFLEYVSGGSISSIIEKFGLLSESIIRIYTRQILEGLEYLHAKKIIHRGNCAQQMSKEETYWSIQAEYARLLISGAPNS